MKAGISAEGVNTGAARMQFIAQKKNTIFRTNIKKIKTIIILIQNL
jgi:hypothetical protein